MFHPAGIVFVTVVGLASGQNVIGTLPSPMTCNVQLGGQTQAATQPIGALPVNGNLSAVKSVGFSQVVQSVGSWDTWSDLATAGFTMSYSAACTGAPSGQAAYDAEVLLTLSAPTLMDVVLRLVPQVQITAGQVAPLLRVDVGDNGIVELHENSASPVTLARTIGPGGLTVRCRFAGAVLGDGLVGSQASVLVLPSSMGVAFAATGCDGTSVTAVPRFDGDLMLGSSATSPGYFSVLVLGLAVQPTVVGNFGGSLPCVLWATGDVVLFVQPFALTTLAIPPGASPFQFWVQSASFLGSAGFSTSDALQIVGR